MAHGDDGDDETGHFEVCMDCGAQSPVTHGTLISARYGWRARRYLSPDGHLVMEWRCPRCYEVFKRGSGGSNVGPLPSPPAGAGSGEPTSRFRSADVDTALKKK